MQLCNHFFFFYDFFPDLLSVVEDPIAKGLRLRSTGMFWLRALVLPNGDVGSRFYSAVQLSVCGSSGLCSSGPGAPGGSRVPCTQEILAGVTRLPY